MILFPLPLMETFPDANGLESGLELLHAGYRLVVLRPGMKAPLHRGWQEREYTEVELRLAYKAGCNVGVKTGGDLVLLDIDSDDPQKLAWVIEHCGDTPMKVKTPRGGLHLYFRTRAGVEYGNHVRIRGEPYDMRWNGCFAVTPWSRSEQDIPYEWLGDVLPANQLPLLKVSSLRERKRARKLTIDPCDDVHLLVRRAQAYIAKILSVSGQQGHSSCYRAVCKLRDFGLSAEQAWPVLLYWNETNAIPPWTEKELRHKILSVFGKS